MKFKKYSNFIIGMPSFLWLCIFYAFPVFVIFLYAFKPSDSNGGIGDGWTFETIYDFLFKNPSYPKIIWRTLWQGVVSTAVCISLAIPISYYLAKMKSPKHKNLLLMLIIVPFWTNFLIRIYAWKVLLHADGPFKHLLVAMGLASDSTMLLYNQWAVLAVMIYTYIPFAILPIYAIAEKFDFSLLDAAKDLGASSFYAFRRIFLPNIMNGVNTAIMVVLIPAFGAYLIPNLVGGPTSELLGDKIAQRVFVDRNLPHASVLSAFLMLIVFIPLLLSVQYKKLHAGKAAAKDNMLKTGVLK